MANNLIDNANNEGAAIHLSGKMFYAHFVGASGVNMKKKFSINKFISFSLCAR